MHWCRRSTSYYLRQFITIAIYLKLLQFYFALQINYSDSFKFWKLSDYRLIRNSHKKKKKQIGSIALNRSHQSSCISRSSTRFSWFLFFFFLSRCLLSFVSPLFFNIAVYFIFLKSYLILADWFICMMIHACRHCQRAERQREKERSHHIWGNHRTAQTENNWVTFSFIWCQGGRRERMWKTGEM